MKAKTVTIMHTASCRFCGQIVQFEGKAGLPEEELVELASRNCQCEQAKEYGKWWQQEEIARANISSLFGDGAEPENREDEAIIELLNAAAAEICHGEVEGIAMSLQGNIKAKISRNSRGEIKVERVETKKRQLTG